MPWFPEYVSAVEMARRQTRAAGQADPVGQYFRALSNGDVRTLETAWPGHVVIYDPVHGEIHGHRRLREFVRQSRSWLADRQASIETVASTVAGDRAVVELLVHLVSAGKELAWPAAIVAEMRDDLSVEFRSYFSEKEISGQRLMRRAILEPRMFHPGDVVGRYLNALASGDVDAVVAAFEADGYYREAAGPPATYRGATELRSFFRACFGAGGGIDLQPCAVTDDGARCALEYNCVHWGRLELPSQAGLAVLERGSGGLLAAVHVYDDVGPPPLVQPGSPSAGR
jgi:ketosteroid isomerase-like protein